MNAITSKEAAKELGCTARAVQMHCKAQKIEKLGRDYMITPKILEKLRKLIHSTPGRPRKL